MTDDVKRYIKIFLSYAKQVHDCCFRHMDNKPVALILAMLMSLFISSCGESLDLSEFTAPVARITLRPADLPDGWVFASEYYNKEMGGINYVVGYQFGDKDTSLSISHELTTYKDVEAGKTAFVEWYRKWFNQYWLPMQNFHFQPTDLDDLYRYGCMSSLMNNLPITSCTFLQQHRQVVSLILVDTDRKAMTFDQMLKILQNIDNRLNKEVLP